MGGIGRIGGLDSAASHSASEDVTATLMAAAYDGVLFP